VTYKDAVAKMRFAATNLKATGQPFFLVTGIKRPHLNWRSPAGYQEWYPLDNVSVPTQLTLDKSIDPVAYSVFPMSAPGGVNGVNGNFVKSPYVHGSDEQLKELRAACEYNVGSLACLLRVEREDRIVFVRVAAAKSFGA